MLWIFIWIQLQSFSQQGCPHLSMCWLKWLVSTSYTSFHRLRQKPLSRELQRPCLGRGSSVSTPFPLIKKRTIKLLIKPPFFAFSFYKQFTREISEGTMLLYLCCSFHLWVSYVILTVVIFIASVRGNEPKDKPYAFVDLVWTFLAYNWYILDLTSFIYLSFLRITFLEIFFCGNFFSYKNIFLPCNL